MEPPTRPTNMQRDLADDILRGAEEIARFIFGPQGNRRQVYYLVEYARLPVFRLGTALCARRSVLLGWIAGQERRAISDHSAGTRSLPGSESIDPYCR
jgi:hypothetical protein